MMDAEKGVCCRQCGCRHLPVVRTRPAPGGRVMRIRECRHCGRNMVTYEVAAGETFPAAFGDLTPKQRETVLSKLLQLFGIHSR